MVHFVGAGPGAADLITIRGAMLLKEADVVIYAGSLVNPGLLQYARPECKIYNSAQMTLEEILSVYEQAEQDGKVTVRLHTGDPCLYGAIREQMDALAERGIDYDYCPGVSSFCAAAAALKAEYTLPGVSQTVILTRRAGRTPVSGREDIRKLAAHGATMVVFLSTGMLKELSAELIEGGYAPDTPAAICYKASWPEELVVRCQVKDLYEAAMKHQITKTALIVVGNVLGDDYELSRLYDQNFETEFRKVKTEDRKAETENGKAETENGKAETENGKNGKPVVGIMSFTDQGDQLGYELAEKWKAGRQILRYCFRNHNHWQGKTFMDGKQAMAELFAVCDEIILIGACGIAVRLMDGLLQGKDRDPAVVVLDAGGKHVISLLSGHLGGANRLAGEIGGLLGARPVITTATDAGGRFSPDLFAEHNDLWIMDLKKAKQVAAAGLAGEKIVIFSEMETVPVPEHLREMVEVYPVTEADLPEQNNALEEADSSVENNYLENNYIENNYIENNNPADDRGEAAIYVGVDEKRYRWLTSRYATVLWLLPRNYILGVGCKRGISFDTFEKEIVRHLESHSIDLRQVREIHSIDRKKDEEAIWTMARRYHLKCRFYDSETLLAVTGNFSSSEFVLEITGVDNVCERSAVQDGGVLVMKKCAGNGVTVAVAQQKGRRLEFL